jgi:glyoxalase-like protein
VLELDHVILVVGDLEEAAARIERDYGLVSLPGGIHPEGTANSVVPLHNSQYLELLTAHDREACSRDDIGRRVLSLIERGGGLAWWGLQTDAIDSIAARTGIEPIPGSIQDADGNTTGSWRGIDPPDDRGGALPFFIQYDQDLAARAARWEERHRQAAHPSGASGFAWVEVAIDEALLRDWVGDPRLPVRLNAGPEGIRRVGLATQGGELVIEA